MNVRPAFPLIQLRDVGYRADGHVILQGVTLDVSPGDFIAITGPNGGGKTTLLRLMLGLIKPTEGTVCNRCPSTGYLPQKTSVDARFPITVAEAVGQGLLGSRIAKAEKARLVADALAEVGLADRASQTLGGLSGGQLQRTLLARAIVANPELLVLDEPLSYLDKAHEHEVYSLLKRLSPATAIVLVSHEMSVFAPMAKTHLIVDRTMQRCPSARHMVHYDCPPLSTP